MTEETKLLLKLLLAQEEESEAGQNKPYVKKVAKSYPGIQRGDLEEAETKTASDFIKEDLKIARREMYAPHESTKVEDKDIPLWAKYALTLPEASSYFHLGYNKLREIVRKDKYAEYLLWNGGRVYIKRKLFEEFLNKETEV